MTVTRKKSFILHNQNIFACNAHWTAASPEETQFHGLFPHMPPLFPFTEECLQLWALYHADAALRLAPLVCIIGVSPWSRHTAEVYYWVLFQYSFLNLQVPLGICMGPWSQWLTGQQAAGATHAEMERHACCTGMMADLKASSNYSNRETKWKSAFSATGGIQTYDSSSPAARRRNVRGWLERDWAVAVSTHSSSWVHLLLRLFRFIIGRFHFVPDNDFLP